MIPGVFVALCLRFDVLKALNASKVNSLIDKDKGEEVLGMIRKLQDTASTHYFYGCLVGYLLAIAATIVVMQIFDHGQPALLYLVPGCLLSVVINALIKGEWSLLWSFSEERFTNDKVEEEEKKKPGSGRKVTYEKKKAD